MTTPRESTLAERVEAAIGCIEEYGDRSPIEADDLRSVLEILRERGREQEERNRRARRAGWLGL